MSELKKKGLVSLSDDDLESVAGGFGEGGVISSGSFSSYTGTASSPPEASPPTRAPGWISLSTGL